MNAFKPTHAIEVHVAGAAARYVFVCVVGVDGYTEEGRRAMVYTTANGDPVFFAGLLGLPPGDVDCTLTVRPLETCIHCKNKAPIPHGDACPGCSNPALGELDAAAPDAAKHGLTPVVHMHNGCAFAVEPYARAAGDVTCPACREMIVQGCRLNSAGFANAAAQRAYMRAADAHGEIAESIHKLAPALAPTIVLALRAFGVQLAADRDAFAAAGDGHARHALDARDRSAALIALADEIEGRS